LNAALELAVRAPSVHNSQPWRFRVGASTIELWADLDRQLPATDPDGRDLLMSCGATLHHLRVALTALGWLPVVERLPGPSEPEHLATIQVIARVPTHEDLALAVSIPRRRTDRRGYSSRAVTDECLDTMARFAAAEGSLLRVVRSVDARAMLVSAIAQADMLQRANPSYVYELARWTGNRDGNRDGVPSANVPPKAGYGDLPVRQFSTAHLHGDDVGSAHDGAGTLVVLGTLDDDRISRLRAGEATSAVLLAATRLRLATCPLTQPLEIPEIRDIVRARVLDHAMIPQMVLRVGWPDDHAAAIPATRRRLVSDVMDLAGG
jgi:nitroreductase